MAGANPAALIAALERRGVSLTEGPDGAVVAVPAGLLNATDLALIHDNRAGILAALDAAGMVS